MGLLALAVTTVDDEMTTAVGACPLVYVGSKCESLGAGGGVALVTGLAVGGELGWVT